MLPDGCADIVWIGHAPAVVAGPATVAAVESLPSDTSVIGVRFRPGAVAAALGVPAVELRDQQRAIEEVLGREARMLDQPVVDAESVSAKLAAVEARVRTHLARALVPDALVIEAASAIEQNLCTRIELAVAHLGISERQLRRRLRDAVRANSPPAFDGRDVRRPS